MKYLGTHEIEGINSKDCFKALKVRLHEIVQKEIENALETHNLDMMQSRNFSSAYGLIDNESLWYRYKGIYLNWQLSNCYNLEKQKENKPKEHEPASAGVQDRGHLDRHLALQE